MKAFLALVVVAVFLVCLPGSAAGKKRKMRAPGKKNLTLEEKMTKDRKSYDFDSISVDGQRRVPLGNLINQKEAGKEYEFVKIRLRWQQEMIQSASNLNL